MGSKVAVIRDNSCRLDIPIDNLQASELFHVLTAVDDQSYTAGPILARVFADSRDFCDIGGSDEGTSNRRALLLPSPQARLTHDQLGKSRAIYDL
jgi:hypothetical protein